MMACSEPVMRHEAAFLAALGSATTYAITGGSLTLFDRGRRTVATFAVESQSLAGTRWTVASYNNGKQAVVSVVAGTRLTASFGRSNDLTGSAGCNDYRATFRAAPPKVSVGPVASTRRYCARPAGVMAQEAAFLAALASAATYTVQGSTLELRTAGGSLAATMQRA